MAPGNHDPEGTLALFDIDGTLTHADTMFAYVRHVVGLPWMLLGLALLSPMLVLARLGLIDRGAAKGAMLRFFLGRRDKPALEAAAEDFKNTVLKGVVRPAGLERLRAHQAEGHRVFLVSASLDLWLAPWARDLGVPLLATPTRWESGRFAGLGGPNNRGPEKVARVRAVVRPEDFARIVAYGDSSGDREMLALADEGHMKPFRDT